MASSVDNLRKDLEKTLTAADKAELLEFKVHLKFKLHYYYEYNKGRFIGECPNGNSTWIGVARNTGKSVRIKEIKTKGMTYKEIED